MCLWKMPKIQQPSVSARELLPSTSSKEPNSPIFGGANDWAQKRRGVQALRINNNRDITNPNSTYKTERSWQI